MIERLKRRRRRKMIPFFALLMPTMRHRTTFSKIVGSPSWRHDFTTTPVSHIIQNLCSSIGARRTLLSFHSWKKNSSRIVAYFTILTDSPPLLCKWQHGLVHHTLLYPFIFPFYVIMYTRQRHSREVGLLYGTGQIGLKLLEVYIHIYVCSLII